ncbi:MAG: S8 family serine peptidase [Deltaproteobacteria bacterium]|nr:S8 family serine peptidase [Deltaproteobacteria bacterium]
MRTAACVLFAAATVLTAVAATAAEPALHKSDVLLARLAARHGYLVSPGFRPIISGWLADKPAAAVPLLVRTHDPEAAADAVARNGGRVGTRAGIVLSVTMPLASAVALLDEPSVRFVEVPPGKFLRLNVSNPEVGALDVENGKGLPMDLDGSGVVLGLVDSGLDLSHPEMKNDDGTSRVKYLWNQDVDPAESPPPEYGYGLECTGAALDEATCNAPDIIGHGTHVSGTMGGDGHKYPGMAPGATFVVAKSNRFDRLIDAAAYVFARADQLGMPCTINMSLGGHYGPHDGTSGEEIGLSELTKTPGHIIVAAAGNEGSDVIHLGYTATADPQKTMLEVRTGEFGDTAVFNTWSEAASEIEFAVGIGVDAGEELIETDWFKGGQAWFETELVKDNMRMGTVGFQSGIYEPNGKMLIDVYVEPNTGNPDTAYGNAGGFQWYLKVRGKGRFDAWSASQGFLAPGSNFSDQAGAGIVPGDNSGSVGMPATSPGIISVAAYMTKNTWKDIEGEFKTVPGTVGAIAFFSSIGPSGDEARTGFKPEVAAPGQYIAAALADDGIVLSPGTQIDRTHVMMQGTSMACPHVNGIVGLMLQADPQLTVEKARRIIMKTAARDSFTGTDQNYTWGAGKVRALPAVKMALGIGFCESDADCREGRTCVSSKCVQSAGGTCYEEGDCAAGLECVAAVCAKPVAPDAGTPDAGPAPDAGTSDNAPDDESSKGCGCTTLGLADDSKTGIQETGIDEISNVKSGGAKGALTAESFLKKLNEAGLKVKDRTEVLGKLVGAGLCIQASAGGAGFTVCEYGDAGQADKGAAKRKAIFGESAVEHVSSGTVLTLAPSSDEKVKKAQAKIAEVFGNLGKSAKKDQKDNKDGKDK